MDNKPLSAKPAANPSKSPLAKPSQAVTPRLQKPQPAPQPKAPDKAVLSAVAAKEEASLSSLVAKCQEAANCQLVPETIDNRYTRDGKNVLAAERAATWSVTVLRGVEAPTYLGSALNAWTQKGVAKVAQVMPDKMHEMVGQVKANSKTVSVLSKAGSLGPLPIVSTLLGTAFAVNDVGGAIAAHQRQEAPSVLLLTDAQAAASTAGAVLGWAAIGVAATSTTVAAAPFLVAAGVAGVASFGLSYYRDHEIADAN